MTDLPAGTVTFLFTDIEGSTRLMQQLGDQYPPALQAHNQALRAAITEHRGRELRTEGDSFFAVFASAVDAVAAAAAAQESLEIQTWPPGGRMRVRMGLHTGEATLIGNDYVGLDVHRGARVASAAHGGQVLISDTTRALVEDGLPPGLGLKDLGRHRLKDLARPERLYQLTVEGLPQDFAPLRTLEGTPNNLPTQMTSFIGRDDQVREGKALLARARLVTLTGPGGTGKTRLSLQIAADLLDSFADGVYFVALSAVRDPALVASAIAQALGVPIAGSRNPHEALLDFVRDKRCLIVLDNFEQLLAAAPVATELIRASAGLRILVSSRAALRVSGEQEFPVPPLALPDLASHPGLAAISQFEAVRLFIERAVAAKPDFTATNENAPAIAGICERVDGLPLAIELAAARVRLFSPQALLSRLNETFAALGTGARDLPGRQQTLRGAIEWSYDLLDEDGRRTLARFGVFARGAALEQAVVVCGPPPERGTEGIDALDQLADQSLLRRVPELQEPRFLMLQTIREYAAQRLEESGEAAPIRDRHVDAFLKLAEAAQPHLFGGSQKAWLDRLEEDHDNFRGALDWCIASRDSRRGMKLAGYLWRLWQMRGHIQEGRIRLHQMLALMDSQAHPVERALALEAAGGLAYWQADMTAAQRFYEQSLELTRQFGDTRAMANAIYNVAFPTLVARTDVARARTLFDEALPLYRETGDEPGVARTLWGLGTCHYSTDDFTGAETLLQESESLFRKLDDDRFGLGWVLHSLGLVAIKQGNLREAKRRVSEALEIFNAAHDVSGVALQLDNASAITRLTGDPVGATRLAAAAVHYRESSGADLGALLSQQEGRQSREGLSEKEAERAWSEGRSISLEQAVAEAQLSLRA